MGISITPYNFGDIAAAYRTIVEHMADDAGHQSLSPGYFFGHQDWSMLGHLAIDSILMGVFVVILFIFIRFATRRVSVRLRDIGLKWAFVIVWIYGFVVYDTGMCNGQYITLLTNAPMAILCAFKIFLFNADISEIRGTFQDSWIYMLNFSLVHFLAAVISTLFLIKYFGFNIVAHLRMWWASQKFGKNVGETYVFWGFNDSVAHLIENIKKEHTNSANYRIVIVRTAKDDNESPEERTGFARIFDFLAMPTSELERLQNLGCLTTGSYTNLAGVNAAGGNEDLIGSTLRLNSLRKLLSARTSRKIHLLFLSDSEKENLHEVALLLNDSTINEFVKNTDGPKREVIFYCLARYNSIHRVIEDQHPSDRIKVKVIDSSHINVEMLKLKKDLLPVSYVDIEADATVSSAFNALVIGFSEVGMDSVRFLYEFGAFVRHGSADGHVGRSEFHLDVVDKNMSDLAGTFVANAPAIRPSMPFINGGENPDALITLHQMDCRSIQFYSKLNREWIEKLNYVVVATDDDELNLSLGIRIFKAAVRYRRNLDKFCILVRAHNDDDGHIRRIKEHYNRLWAAQQCAPEVKGKRIHQDKICVGHLVEAPIHVFGLDRNTFTYANIIADELEQRARKYAQKYAETVDPGRTFSVSAWDDSYNDIMQLTDEWKGYSPTYSGMMNMRRMQSQDIANSLHELTKKILAQKALSRCKQEDFIFSQLTRKPNTIRYIWPKGMDEIEAINRISIAIAQTEHLRWVASHEILGYVNADVKDEARLEHDCLKDWSLLPEAVRSYDCNVADFILGIRISMSPLQ